MKTIFDKINKTQSSDELAESYGTTIKEIKKKTEVVLDEQIDNQIIEDELEEKKEADLSSVKKFFEKYDAEKSKGPTPEEIGKKMAKDFKNKYGGEISARGRKQFHKKCIDKDVIVVTIKKRRSKNKLYL